MKTTPIREILTKEDGEQIIAVQGQVAYTEEVQHGTSQKGVAWSRQFFVLTDGDADIGCTLWDADGNEVEKGEKVLIENTQNKKGQWSGMKKTSYTQRDGTFRHTMEIRANNVRITQPDGTPFQGKRTSPASSENEEYPEQYPTDQGESRSQWENEPPKETAAPPAKPLDNGMQEVRKYLMREINLYFECVRGVEYLGQRIKELTPDTQKLLTPENWDHIVGRIYTGASVGGFGRKMPEKPIK